MSSVNKTNEQDDSESEELTSDSFSDLTLTTSEGEVVHIDVSIVHSATKAVHTAAQSCPQGLVLQPTAPAGRSQTQQGSVMVE